MSRENHADWCHDVGEEHEFDTVPGRMNAARHCKHCSCISLDWDDLPCSVCGDTFCEEDHDTWEQDLIDRRVDGIKSALREI